MCSKTRPRLRPRSPDGSRIEVECLTYSYERGPGRTPRAYSPERPAQSQRCQSSVVPVRHEGRRLTATLCPGNRVRYSDRRTALRKRRYEPRRELVS